MINGMRGLIVGSLLGAQLLLPTSALTDIIGPDDPPPDRPPLVVSAQVPLYPDLLLKAKFDGEVRLRVTTDGERASTIMFESGGKILFTAAEENVRTWRFEPHQPTTFVAVFRYKLLPDSLCFKDVPTVVLHLPTEVQVTSRGFAICEDLSTSGKRGDSK